MRQARLARGRSLRQMETAGRWTRGTLSQVENGKSRPSVALVHWYEEMLGVDGLLVSLYIQARVGPLERGLGPDVADQPAFSFLERRPATGELVRPSAQVEFGWRLRNESDETWHGWSLRRIGAAAGPGLISGPVSIPVAELDPGADVFVGGVLRAPEDPGTTVAYWALSDAEGRIRSRRTTHFTVLLVVSIL